ncbi:helix-turn-helix domain-containing protein [Paenibacillus sp. MMS18-CY102]|uniref:helix-turn-helix domain-containing protein n=1 Tax=Paenibacillus sp. MMS18-CY102 TaxID=2682849 RepID=UPI0013655C3D|nr:helix-turn-helix domain-containing protein [Paenibacillus sp. MMS18-CY102]MWC26659.1 excisionase family DNA-binding protein [Paenibacillus sp. MMS18-CY102]
MNRQTLNVQETADLIGVSSWLIYDMVRRKEIPAIRVRNRIFFRVETLNKWMAEKEVEAVEEVAL